MSSIAKFLSSPKSGVNLPHEQKQIIGTLFYYYAILSIIKKKGVPTGGKRLSPKAEMYAGSSRSEPWNLMRIIPTEE